MFAKKVKKVLLLAAALTVGCTCVNMKPAFAGNSDAAKTRIYNVQVTGQFLRKEALELLNLINEERQRVGEEPVMMDGEAVGVSDIRAVQISFIKGHTIPTEHGEDGIHVGEIFSRINTENGPIEPEEFGKENIAAVSGHQSDDIAKRCFQSWMNVPEYRENMLHKVDKRVGISIFTQQDVSGTYTYYGVLNSLLFSDPETVLFPEDSKYFAVPYTQGDRTVTKAMYLNIQGGCIEMNTEKYDARNPIKIYSGYKTELQALYNPLSGINTIPEDVCLNKFDDSCGTWTTTDPDIVSVSPNGVVTGLKAGTAKVYFNLNGDPDKSSEYLIQVPEIKVGTPGNVSVKKSSDNKVKVSWTEAKNADGYEIRRSKFKSKNFTTVKAVGGKQYTTLNVNPGQKYYYKVRAFWLDGKGKKVYGHYSKTIGYTCPVTAGKLSSVSAGSKTISVKWKKTGGAEGYRICYYQKKGSKNINIRYKNVAGASAVKYTLKNIKKGTYYVKVRAYSLVGGKKVYGKYSVSRKVVIPQKKSSGQADTKLPDCSTIDGVHWNIEDKASLYYKGKAVSVLNVIRENYKASDLKMNGSIQEIELMKKALMADSVVGKFCRDYITPGMSVYDRLAAIQKFYIDSEYSYGSPEICKGPCKGWCNTTKDRLLSGHSAYDLFYGKKAVCGGYAQATYFLCVAVDIPCKILIVPSQNHEKNLIKIPSVGWVEYDLTGYGKNKGDREKVRVYSEKGQIDITRVEENGYFYGEEQDYELYAGDLLIEFSEGDCLKTGVWRDGDMYWLESLQIF